MRHTPPGSHDTNVLTKFHENWAKIENCPANWRPYINKTNVLTKFHDDLANMVTSKVFTRKTAPPIGGHVFQRTGTTFELDQHIIAKNILTNFKLDRGFIGKNLLTKIHEDWTRNVALRAFTMKTAPHPGGHFFHILTKLHEDWACNMTCTFRTRNVASRVFINKYDGQRPITKAHLSNQLTPVTLTLLESMDIKQIGDGRLVAVDSWKCQCLIMNHQLQRQGTPYKFNTNPLDVVCLSQAELAVTMRNKAVCLLSVSPDNSIGLTKKINIAIDSTNSLVLTDRFAHTLYINDKVTGTSRAITDDNIRQPRAVCVGPGDTILIVRQELSVHATLSPLP
ncbi:hypothetical protein DPMN_144423 [Dreissena polymorpha]|uniref:Uncharacterized protein n=1 Tax=Dreissena polymorpha TaxID=45954 RepID=A0A9D4JQ65_DREPO|nr:hypothetical protein DPMN_144423 [Dreissena polymorpha]